MSAAAACRIRAALPPGGGCSPAILPSATARSSAPRWWSAPSPRKTVCETARRKTQGANEQARKQRDRAQAVNQGHAGAMLLTENAHRRVDLRCSWLKCNQTAHAVGQGMQKADPQPALRLATKVLPPRALALAALPHRANRITSGSGSDGSRASRCAVLGLVPKCPIALLPTVCFHIFRTLETMHD